MAATRWISSPSTPITPAGGFIGASAPAGRVAPSMYRQAMCRPSGEKARLVTPPWRWVSRRAVEVVAAGAVRYTSACFAGAGCGIAVGGEGKCFAVR